MDSRTTKENSKRLHIIGANEVAAIYDLPRFTTEDQANFFSLSAHSSQLLLQKQGFSNLEYTFWGDMQKYPLSELKSLRGSWGLPIERDLHFKLRTLKELHNWHQNKN